LNDALFPSVVDSDAAQREDRLQTILVQGTKLSLALGAPLCLGLIVLADPLVAGWVGPRFSESVLPTQILLAVVLVRVSTASANLILRGAGQHRLLAFTNASAAIVNVALSVALVRPLGLVGVALGTFVPVTISTAFVLFPAACRRVAMPIHRPVLRAMWPAIWPALVMIALLRFGAPLRPDGLRGVALHFAAGGLVYAGLFLAFAMDADERRLYWTKVRALVARQRRAPVAG
jgi:O-antigen/teichoic acid export membrane protein